MSQPADLGPTGGVVWSRPEEWASRRRPDGCVICVAGAPLDVVADFPTCWATVPREAPLVGYVCVVAREHVNEPFVGGPIDPRSVRLVRTDEQIRGLGDAIRAVGP
jgi:hypothetical protein